MKGSLAHATPLVSAALVVGILVAGGTDASLTSPHLSVPALSPSTLTALTAPAGSAKDYRLVGTPAARWDPCKTINYRINPRFAPRGAINDVKGAVARVSTATGLRYAYKGTTTIIPGYNDARGYGAGTNMVVAWSNDGMSRYFPKLPKGFQGPAGVGGATWASLRYNSRTYNVIRQGYVVLSTRLSTLAAGFGPSPRYGWVGTRGQLYMHELGHSVGLEHARGTSQIMYPNMTAKAASWGAGDLAGLRLVGRSRGCIPKAAYGG